MTPIWIFLALVDGERERWSAHHTEAGAYDARRTFILEQAGLNPATATDEEFEEAEMDIEADLPMFEITEIKP